jgi:hypothetical protein
MTSGAHNGPADTFLGPRAYSLYADRHGRILAPSEVVRVINYLQHLMADLQSKAEETKQRIAEAKKLADSNL